MGLFFPITFVFTSWFTYSCGFNSGLYGGRKNTSILFLFALTHSFSFFVLCAGCPSVTKYIFCLLYFIICFKNVSNTSLLNLPSIIINCRWPLLLIAEI